MNSRPICEASEQAEQHERGRARDNQPARGKGCAQHRLVEPARSAHENIFLFRNPAAKKERDGRRDEGDGKDKRGGEREHHGVGHGVKHFPLDPLEREDWQIHHQDDADAENARLDHFAGGLEDDRVAFA